MAAASGVVGTARPPTGSVAVAVLRLSDGSRQGCQANFSAAEPGRCRLTACQQLGVCGCMSDEPTRTLLSAIAADQDWSREMRGMASSEIGS
jgi:hypothetical protein